MGCIKYHQTRHSTHSKGCKYFLNNLKNLFLYSIRCVSKKRIQRYLTRLNRSSDAPGKAKKRNQARASTDDVALTSVLTWQAVLTWRHVIRWRGADLAVDPPALTWRWRHQMTWRWRQLLTRLHSQHSQPIRMRHVADPCHKSEK